MTQTSKITRLAAITAFVIAGLTVIGGLLQGPIIAVPMALVPLCAGLGILKQRAWSAYGYSLCAFAQLLILPILLSRPGASNMEPELMASAGLAFIIAVLFLVTGVRLARSGAPKGRPMPWLILTAALTVPLVFVQAFVIPTTSMENTLLSGDHIVVRKIPSEMPKRDELLAFIYPVDRKQTYIKRVIGIPGDRIRISQKVVYRNGVALQEPYAAHKTVYMDTYRDFFPSEPNAPIPAQGLEMLAKNVSKGELIVSAGEYFVLGDNRDNSFDSRYWGLVGSGDVIGRPIFVYDSLAPKGGRRWNRLFKLL